MSATGSSYSPSRLMSLLLHRGERSHGPEFSAHIRALVRGSEVWLVIVAAMVGIVSGTAVTGMRFLAHGMQVLSFGIDPDARLSTSFDIPPLETLAVPIAGGIAMGVLSLALMRWRRRAAVDPIEANALHGGRMSVTDSLILAAQTILSNGAGASVGLEAGYTQISSALGSRMAVALRLRRQDTRVLVGCGAAAAIAAAFNAPLTGAFYAFELIVGTYTVATVAPVMAAALASTLVSRAFGEVVLPIQLFGATPTAAPYFLLFMAIGLICGLAGIAIMYAVTLVERLFQATRLPAWIRPSIGGLIVGGLALITPQILSAGHGAMHLNAIGALPISGIVMLLLLKVAASAVSLGSGFRGGLFFASLFLGSLLGRLISGVLAITLPAISVEPTTLAVISMSALAVAIVGGPLTMTFLALEITGDFLISMTVLAAAVVSSITVRELFGYSFSTWRLHLRGETIRSAHDVGLIRNLTAGKMMRSDVRTVRSEATLAEFKRQFPLGSTQRVIAVDNADRYAGIVMVPDVYGAEVETEDKTLRVRDYLRFRDNMLLPQMNAKEAIASFDIAESEALAVVDDRTSRQVLGLLTEAHATRRYAEELDKARQSLAGER